MKEKINVTRTSLPPFEEYCSEIRKFWDSRILTNMGEEHEAFRVALERRLEVPHAVLFTNGHLALEAALAAFRLPAGDVPSVYRAWRNRCFRGFHDTR